MKKIVVLIGSRRKKGHTVTFVRSVLERLPKDKFESEYIFPQDFKISPCVGCGSCFEQIKCVLKDEISVLQQKILDADVFVVASPVYLHYMTADLLLFLERSSWWTHTLRLQGKPVVVLSTCHSNGHRTVIETVSQTMTYMGGNVIAALNGSQFPEQLNNEVWLKSVAQEINRRIIKFSGEMPQSNQFLEHLFINLKEDMITRGEMLTENNQENGELKYWKETGLIECNSFSDYLLSANQKIKCS